MALRIVRASAVAFGLALLLAAPVAVAQSAGPTWQEIGTYVIGLLVAGVAAYATHVRVLATTAHKRIDALLLKLAEDHPTHDDMKDEIAKAIRLAIAETLPKALDDALLRHHKLHGHHVRD